VNPTSPHLLALDWGTSSLRAYLLDGPAAIRAERRADWGILHLPEGGFAGALESLCGDWLQAFPQLPIVAAGMVGSAQGWVEAPYVHAPASVDQLGACFAFADGPAGRRVAIVPGMLLDGALPDVMRGEETQVFGALAQECVDAADQATRLVVLPGTHSKWVCVRGRSIISFKTFMTGELFAVLCKHSILGRLMQPAAAMDEAAFEQGLALAQRSGAGGLPGCLFSARSLGLTGKMQPEQLGDYLSGLLIGHELKEALAVDSLQSDVAPLLIGDASLCSRYRFAFSLFGVRDADALPQTATSSGLWAVAQAAGLLNLSTSSLPC
jgi:2-dehydro-3-deoxygalactonokinase